MRIIVVTTSFPRTDEDPSGHFVLASARALARAGNEVHVIAPGGSLLDPPRAVLAPSPLDGPNANGRCVLKVHAAGGSALFAWPGAVARLREKPWRAASLASFAIGVRARLARLGRFDRAVAHWIVPSAWPLLALSPSSFRELEVVAHGADVRLLVASPRAVRERVFDNLFKNGARFTFAAKTLLEALEAALPRALARELARASSVKPPPIDLPHSSMANESQHLEGLRRSLMLGEGDKVVVTACRLIQSKRVELAIDAARELGPGVRLVVVGDGPERARLEAHARATGAPVSFVGALARHEALAWIASADALVHASAVEAAPTVIREARALGIAVVACDAGDVAAWARADAGITMAGPTPAALASALRARLTSTGRSDRLPICGAFE